MIFIPKLPSKRVFLQGFLMEVVYEYVFINWHKIDVVLTLLLTSDYGYCLLVYINNVPQSRYGISSE